MAAHAAVPRADLLANLLDGPKFHSGNDFDNLGIGNLQATANNFRRATIAIAWSEILIHNMDSNGGWERCSLLRLHLIPILHPHETMSSGFSTDSASSHDFYIGSQTPMDLVEFSSRLSVCVLERNAVHFDNTSCVKGN